MPVIDDIKENNQKMKGKGLKANLQYFWDYYKIPTLAVIVVGLILFSLIKTTVTAKDNAFTAIMINAYEAPDAESFAEYIEIDTEEAEVFFDTGYQMSSNPEGVDQSTYVNSQKIMAVISASAADVMVGDPAVIQNYMKGEIFADLRDYFDEETFKKLDSEGKVIYYQPVDEETGEPVGDELPLAIEVGDAPSLINAPSFFYDSVYFSVIVNTPHPDYCKAFYEWIYK